MLGQALRSAKRLQWLIVTVLTIASFHAALAQLDGSSGGSQIEIVSPVDGTTFQRKANVAVKIQGMDVPDVGHVIRLLENGIVFRSLVLDPLAPPQAQPVMFELTFDVDDLRAGHYTFVAMIDDVSSSPVTIIVKRHRPPPHR